MTEELPVKKRHWLFRLFRFFYILFISILLLMYVTAGSAATYLLTETLLVRRHSLAVLPYVIDKAVEKNRPNDVVKWVRLRPLSETKAIIDIVAPKSMDLEPSIFFELSKRELLQQRQEESLFWSQLGRFRLRFDAVRCGFADAFELLDKLQDRHIYPQLRRLLEERPELLKKSIQQVLDFDAKYPARNNPEFLCKVLHKVEGGDFNIMERQFWDAQRQNMRLVTEVFLKSPDPSPPVKK